MLNLIINAIHAMSGVAEERRELHISTEIAEPKGVRVGVQDTGPGLSPETLPRLFEPFYTTKPDGTGMGLSICRWIIETHGGRLWATGCEPQGAPLSVYDSQRLSWRLTLITDTLRPALAAYRRALGDAAELKCALFDRARRVLADATRDAQQLRAAFE
jgi:Histidine kinase-, DNA gyrase B-, and HSP90-like ATPase